MLTLYVKTGCPYCAVALKKIDDLGLKIEERNIADPFVSDDLIEKGGKRQVPYLVDDENSVSMYESKDIVNYLDAYYGDAAPVTTLPTAASSASNIRLHRSDDSEVCEACQ